MCIASLVSIAQAVFLFERGHTRRHRVTDSGTMDQLQVTGGHSYSKCGSVQGDAKKMR